MNAPYDSGLAIVREGPSRRAARGASAANLTESERRDGARFTPECRAHPPLDRGPEPDIDRSVEAVARVAKS